MKYLQAGYYICAGRICLVRSFLEGLSILRLDDQELTRVSHGWAGGLHPISFKAAQATGLIETELYTRQVASYPIAVHLSKEPLIGLLLLEPYNARPGITSRDHGVWLKSIHVHSADSNIAVLTFKNTYTYFDAEYDEDRSIHTSRGIAVPIELIDTFDLKTYRKWLKEAVLTARKNLQKHIGSKITELKSIADTKYRP